MSFQEDAAVQWGVNASLALAVEERERESVCVYLDGCVFAYLGVYVCVCVCVCVPGCVFVLLPG